MGAIYRDRKSGLFLPESVRPQAKGYSEAGASRTRRSLKSFTARSGSPNEDIHWNNATLRQRGRMLYMSAPVAASAINTNRTKVVGVGLTLKSAIDRDILGLSPEEAKAWQRRTEKEFELWSSRKSRCDATGMNNFAGIQQLALVSWLMSGDCFVLFKRTAGRNPKVNPYSLRLHLIEADRVSTPDRSCGYGVASGPFYSMTDGKNEKTGNRIYDGVEVDGDGLAVAYHVRNTYPYQLIHEETKWTRVEAYGKRTGFPNVLHIMSSERPDQYRGVTYLAQAIEPILQLRRYIDSALMMALVQSFYTAWIVTKDNPNAIHFNEVGAGDVAGIPGANPIEENISRRENEYEMRPGTVNTLAEDEDIKFGNPTMPVARFDEFVKTYCKIIGAGLGIPYDVLIKEYTASYSAARWIGPVQASLDPLQEVKAAVMQIQNALKTHEQVAREMGGGDWDENVEQLADEMAKLSEAGVVPANLDADEDGDKGDDDNAGE